MKRVLGYIRVSTDGQLGEERYGLAAQKQMIVEYCMLHNLNIVDWVSDEGLSGAEERPGFDSIVFRDWENIDGVVVAKTDRVARDMNLYFYYKMLLRKKGMDLYSVLDETAHFGEYANVIEAFLLFTAEQERKNINRRTTAGRRVKASKGGYSGGKVPFGYHAENGNYIIDADEAKVVRYIYKRHDEGAGFSKIAHELNRRNSFKTRKGKKFYPTSVRSILLNEKTYRGYYKYGGNDWVKGAHEPILR